MTHIADRPRVTKHESIRNNPDRLRKGGTTTLSAAEVRRPAAERKSSAKELLGAGVHSVVKNRLQDVRQYHREVRGEDLPLTVGATYLAYAAQKVRLNDSDLTDDMTMAQLSREMIAKAVLLGPSASEALTSPRYHKNKLILAEHNDTIRDLVATVSPRMLPDVVSVVQEQSLGLGRATRQTAFGVSKKGYVEQLVQGARSEIAVEHAIGSDPDLSVAVPEDVRDDLKGIDLTATRISDGRGANYDVKGSGAYLGRIKELRGMNYGDKLDLNGMDSVYYYTGMHENGMPHYLINAGAELFGDIETSSNDFTPGGQARIRQIVHETIG